MILRYSEFIEVFNKKLFEDSYSSLLEKIAKNPERYIGLFRPTKPKTKLIQNITQSHEIRFGDALESIFEIYFSKVGFNILEKRFYNNDKEVWKKWADLGVLAVEMESYALYINAAKFNKKALTVLSISDSLVTKEETSSETRQTGFTKMMNLALEIASDE